MIEVNERREASMTSLVASIANDAGKLIEQQFILLRRELGEEIRRVRIAAITMATGVGLATVGAFFLLLMLVHVVHTFTEIPLWGCYGLVGGLLAILGGLALFFGKKEAGDIQLLPPPQTAEAVKENVEWLKNPTNSRNP